MPRVFQQSNHCLIDRPTHMRVFRGVNPLLGRLYRAWYEVDPEMHFTGPTGLVWRALGVGRSTKNPNVCTL